MTETGVLITLVVFLAGGLLGSLWHIVNTQGKRLDDFKYFFSEKLNHIDNQVSIIEKHLTNHVTETNKKIDKLDKDVKEVQTANKEIISTLSEMTSNITSLMDIVSSMSVKKK